jgi:heme/copper-type cytochrome/quinol oxidase subunit 3
METALDALAPAPSAYKPKVNLARFGMLTFLASEAMLFSGLICGYIVLRGAAGWSHGYRPEGAPPLPAGLTGFNTVLLVLSSITCIIAERDVVRGKRPTLWLFITMCLGGTFVAVQAREWTNLYHEHMWFNSTGEGEFLGKGHIYSSNFFALTGFHGLHVFIGVCLLGVTVVKSFFGEFNPQRYAFLDCVALYWHFVDIVWIFLFTILYLL